MHSFHLFRSYFETSYSASLKAMCLRMSEMKWSVVSVKKAFRVLLKVFWSTLYAMMSA